MSDDKQINVEELLGLTDADLHEMVERVDELDHLLGNIHEVDPRLLAAAAWTKTDRAGDIAIDAASTEGQLRGALSGLVFTIALLVKRIEHDHPENLIISPSEVH